MMRLTSLIFQISLISLISQIPMTRAMLVRALCAFRSSLQPGVLCAVLLLSPPVAVGKTAQPAAADPALEVRVMLIAEELRCLVCQNETIAASHAELAVDLRQQIREQLQQGRSSAQILDFMAERYGDFVLYRPPFKTLTALLWIGPFALLLLAASLLLWHIRRRTQEPATALSPEDLQRAQQLLGEPGARRQGGRS